MTAYKCGTLDFNAREKNGLMCATDSPRIDHISLLDIYHKIRLECFFWGLGTSIGELPPYFVARAAAQAGRDDPDFVGIERIMEKPVKARTVAERGQVVMYKIVQNMGFFGILLCASVPNPLFDLAGIICGHFSVPFATFWGATFVGKALVKNTIQCVLIIIMFSEGVLDRILGILKEKIPLLHSVVQSAISSQVRAFGGGEVGAIVDGEQRSGSIFGFAWNLIIGGMVSYFGFSLIEALAMQELRRQHEAELSQISADLEVETKKVKEK
ncbi:hypothetical protein HDV05_004544 [Chytridiales sp. JEL 0842]|nr:hypothetical protein HDV05_004544 [Chytridiales sp. JEL 0842]